MNITYDNDYQFVDDVARIILKTHIENGGYVWRNMHQTVETIRETAIETFVKSNPANDGMEKWYTRERAAYLVEKAYDIAAKKWNAAMILLGI